MSAKKVPPRQIARKTAKRNAAPTLLTEERYRELFDALAEGVVMIAADGHVIAANTSAVAILGMNAREIERALRRDEIWRAVREDDSDYPPRDFPVRKSLRTGKALKNVLVGIRPHLRKLRWLSVSVRPVFEGRNRQPVAVVASFEDVTRRRQIETEHAQLAAAVQASADAITRSGLDSKFQSWNPGAEKLFGYPAKEAIGKRVGWMIPDHLRAEMLQYRQRVLDGETIVGWQTQRTRKDGARIAVESSYAAIRDSTGKITGIVGVHRDISKMEEILKRLQASEHLFRAAFDAMPDVFLIYDASLQVKFINQRGAEIVDKPYKDIIGKRDIDLLPPEVTRTYLPTLEQTRDSGTTQSVEASFSLRGRSYAIAATYVPMLDDAGNIVQILGMLHDFTKRRQTEERLAFLAQYDSLTGLPNRYLLLDRLEASMRRATRNNKLLGVMFLDLDRFKEINDTRGHAAGDILLQQVAERLAGTLRASDTIARLGGDEFTILVEATNNVDEITAVANKVLAAFEHPFETEAGEVFTTTSIGISVYPFDDDDHESLLRNADIAMYHAKQERNSWQLYRADMNANSVTRQSMEVEMRRAVERDEFALYFQPQVRVDNGKLVGFEALIRWNNDKLGHVGPADFIPLAEHTGLIVPIGEWILRKACEHCKAWERTGFSPLPISVNISAPQFRRGNLQQLVSDLLAEYSLDPRWLALEITESSIMRNSESAVKTLAGLRNLGVMLAIDDFGTGYSSLSYLKRFPVDKLKIDQSFVRDLTEDPNDAAIVSAIIAMSKQLGLKTIAEGVETKEQLAFLARLKCEEYQGFLFGKPVPAAQVPMILRSQRSGLARGR